MAHHINKVTDREVVFIVLAGCRADKDTNSCVHETTKSTSNQALEVMLSRIHFGTDPANPSSKIRLEDQPRQTAKIIGPCAWSVYHSEGPAAKCLFHV